MPKINGVHNLKNQSVLLLTANGFGSTNTGVARFSTIQTNESSKGLVSYTDDAALGSYFTALVDCTITLSTMVVGAAAGGTAYITINATNLLAAGSPGGTVVCSGVVQAESTGGNLSLTSEFRVIAGQIVRVQKNSAAGIVGFSNLNLFAEI